MIRWLFLAIFIFIAALIKGADDLGIIKGRIFDGQTFESLPLASIVYGEGLGITSDKDGFYILKVEPGNVILVFRFIGYKSVTRSVFVPSNDTLFLDIGLDIEVTEIDQIVISAGKVEQRLAELTVSMNIIKPQTLSASHITDATELLNKTPGIEVLDGQASIRGGSGFSYSVGSRVLALIDGLPVLSADAGNIKWQFLPLENLSQIEIIKGASSVLYGSSALNGIINFRTAEAGNQPVTRFYVESGVFDKPRQRDWIWWDSPRTFSSTSFSHNQRSGNTDMAVTLHLLSNNGYRKLNEEKLGRLNLKFRHDDQTVEGLSYGVNVNTGITSKTDFVLWEDSWAGALKHNESTAIQLKGNLITVDPYITLKKEGRYRHDLRTRLQTSQNKFPEAGNNNSDAVSFFAEYQLRYSFTSSVDMNFGIVENYSRISSPFYGDHDALNLAGYIQADISLTERIKIVSGIRIEQNILDGLSDSFIPLFRTGINYRLMDYTFLRASFGQGYRYPSIAEKFAATTLGAVRIVPNPLIKPESGWSSEIGMKQGIINGRWSGQIDIALFYSRNSDMIEYLFKIYPNREGESINYGFEASNVEHSRVYGGEFEFSLNHVMGRFANSLTGGYVFMYPVEFNPQTGRNKDIYLKYRRKHSFKISFGSEYEKFDFGFSLQAGSRIINIDDVFLHRLTREIILPGFYDYWNNSVRGHIVIDPFLGYSLNNKLKLSLVVKNILNTEYMGRPGDIMPHRNFSLRLSGNL